MSRRFPRQPRADQQTSVAAWLRFYSRCEAYYNQSAALLEEYPAAQASCREYAANYGRGVTELLIGAHPNQVSGEWR